MSHKRMMLKHIWNPRIFLKRFKLTTMHQAKTRQQSHDAYSGHLDENLKIEYLNKRDPYGLCENLKDRYDHLREVMLSKYRHEGSKLRFQDFNKVGEYNYEIFKIVSHLRFVG